MNSEITDEQIEQLRDEMAVAGDLEQVALCDWALGHVGSASTALRDTKWSAEGVTRADARAECERVIRAAAAMVD